MQKIGPMYESYFQSILNVYNGKGWYEESNESNSINIDKGIIL